jgi:hypothetical protein
LLKVLKVPARVAGASWRGHPGNRKQEVIDERRILFEKFRLQLIVGFSLFQGGSWADLGELLDNLGSNLKQWGLEV